MNDGGPRIPRATSNRDETRPQVTGAALGHSVSTVLDNAKAGTCIYCAHQAKLHDALMSEVSKLRYSSHEPRAVNWADPAQRGFDAHLAATVENVILAYQGDDEVLAGRIVDALRAEDLLREVSPAQASCALPTDCLNDWDLENVRKEMLNRGWRPDAKGEPDCFDQASAMAEAAIRELQARRAAQPQEARRCEQEQDGEAHDLQPGVVCVACYNRAAQPPAPAPHVIKQIEHALEHNPDCDAREMVDYIKGAIADYRHSLTKSGDAP